MAGSLQTSPTYSLTPSASKSTLASNYLTNFDFLNQYLPDTYEKEFARYGDRSLNAFLRASSSEIPFSSDLIKWSEQGRLHTKYTNVNADDAAATDIADFTLASGTCNFRLGQTVVLSSDSVASTEAKGVIVAVSGSSFTVAFYKAAGSPFVQNTKVTAFVYGSEFKKGTYGMQGSLEADPLIFDVSPIIIKDKYAVSGSDMAQISWIEVDNDGRMGYLWYLKSESDTRKRYEDYLEMALVEGQEAEAGSGVATQTTYTDAGNKGTEGLFETLSNRGNVWSGGTPSSMTDIDAILQRLDKQGAIQENLFFIDRQFSLDIDDMLATQNASMVGGTSWGLFDNSKDMGLSLGFTDFRRGSYDFYKTDWKYLNDATTRGGLVGGSIGGVLAPAGTTTVYDQVLGANAKRPFLHVRYRKSETVDRRYKTWITGSAGEEQTNDLDAMEVNFLSERALCTLGANNFFLFEK